MINFGRCFPKDSQPMYVNLLLLLFGYKRGMVASGKLKSLYNAPFVNSSDPEVRYHFDLPPVLHERVIRGEEKGVITGGHGNC